MPWAILDTNVYIGHWERGLFAAELASVLGSFVIRHSSVVFSELRRGARTAAATRHVTDLRDKATAEWTPTASDWWDAGALVREVGDAEGWDVQKRREFQNDSLIALTACRHGATVVTADRHDFELLERRLRVKVLAVAAPPELTTDELPRRPRK